MGTKLAIAGTVTASLAAGAATVAYRRDLARAHQRLASVDRTTVPTTRGDVEFAERGAGAPVLVSHGIFHGADGGLRSVRDVVLNARVISPSRFGYLGSAMPADASAPVQADAFVELLDHLGIGTVSIIGISAGTSTAVQMALRHPDRIDRLIISSGNWPGSPTSEAPPDWATWFYTDPMMWLMKTVAPPFVAQLMGVPDGFPSNDEDTAEIADMLDSIFPISQRAEGAIFDAFVSNPDIVTYPLEQISVATLIIHAIDDPLASHDAAVRAAERIPGARMVSLDSGGHLGLGQTATVRAEIGAFLAQATA